MTEILAKSVSDVHGIIQNYEIENNSKFRVTQRMREQTDRQFLTEKVFEDFYYVLTLFCIIRYHIHIPYHFCLLNSCFGIYKSILVAALKKF